MIKEMNVILMEQLRRLNDPNNNLEIEKERAEGMAKVAQQIVKSAETILKASEITGNKNLLIQNELLQIEGEQ